MEPINYLAQVADPFAQATQGLKFGAGMAELQQKQALMAQQQQQQQLALQEQAKFFTNPNPTMRDAARYASSLSPEQSKAFLPFMEGISKEQQQNTLKQTGQLLSALQLNPEIGISKLKENAIASRNSGDEADATLFERLAEAAADPKQGKAVVFQSLVARTAGIPGAKEMFETFAKGVDTVEKQALSPSVLKEAVAKADKAVADAIVAKETATNAPAMAKADADLKSAQAAKALVDAEFARANAVLDVQKKGVDIRKTNEDIIINRENARIAALNAAISKEKNTIELKKLQQTIDDAKEKRDAADREQRATLANQSADIDNFINTAERIKQTPKNIINAATGPIASRLPTTNQDVADFEALVETLGSQAFLAQIPKIKGTGNLTEKEGDKLQASLQNLSLKQSPERLLANVDEAVRLLEKAKVTITARSGLPAIPSDIPARELNVTVNGVTFNFPNKAAADAFKNSDAYRRAAGIR